MGVTRAIYRSKDPLDKFRITFKPPEPEGANFSPEEATAMSKSFWAPLLGKIKRKKKKKTKTKLGTDDGES